MTVATVLAMSWDQKSSGSLSCLEARLDFSQSGLVFGHALSSAVRPTLGQIRGWECGKRVHRANSTNPGYSLQSTCTPTSSFMLPTEPSGLFFGLCGPWRLWPSPPFLPGSLCSPSGSQNSRPIGLPALSHERVPSSHLCTFA